MPKLSRFRFPALKLRGTIVLAAGIVFAAGILANLYYVVSSLRQSAIAQGNAVVTELAESEAGRINQALAVYANTATAIARTGSALHADPTMGPRVYGNMTLPFMEGLDGAYVAYMLFTDAAGFADRPRFTISDELLEDNWFGPFAQRGADGAVTINYDMVADDHAWADEPLAVGAPNISLIPSEGMIYTTFHDMIRDTAGKVIGISGVAFDGASLNDIIGGEPPMGTGIMAVMSHDGHWMVNPDRSRVGLIADEPWAVTIRERLANADTYQYEDNIEGDVVEVTARKFDVVGSQDQWIIMVAVPQSTLLAEANAQTVAMMVGGLVVLGLGLAAFWFLGSYIAKPVSRMTGVMRRIADNEYDLEVPYAGRTDEIGEMAAAVEVFRANGLKVAQMTEAEAARIVADEKARAEMMAQLQAAFGDVVDAAVAGDFSRRVEVEFPDKELNSLAASINNLVETVDRGLSETGRVLTALANTDLTQTMQGDYRGAFARLRDDINAVTAKLAEIVGGAMQISGSLKQATGEILSGMNDLSERTTRQAATIEETSAAMEQLAQTVMENAKRANEASGASSEVTRTAEAGGEVMGEATEAMTRIETSTSKVSNIIGMIDDIAFQTNLLALNASVEAARAGEAGKGFAVVAVEVRRLAQSSAEASAEVKALIEASAGEVKTGSKLVADAASKLETLLVSARSFNTLMEGIARESREQASAIEEVNVAVRQMDEMVQHNAALVEETNAAIAQTEEQASQLDGIVSVFTLENAAPRAEKAPERGIKALQQKVAASARAYLSQGSAAISTDWNEF